MKKRCWMESILKTQSLISFTKLLFDRFFFKPVAKLVKRNQQTLDQ